MQVPSKASLSAFQLAAFYHRGAACAQSSGKEGVPRRKKSEIGCTANIRIAALTYLCDSCRNDRPSTQGFYVCSTSSAVNRAPSSAFESTNSKSVPDWDCF